jgi:hypothetical protein
VTRKPLRRVVIVDGGAPGRLLLRELLDRNVECLHLRSSAPAPGEPLFDTAGYDADLGHAGDVSDAIQLLGELNPTAVVAGSNGGVAYAEAAAEDLGLPTNRLDRFAARTAARAALATARTGPGPWFLVNSVSWAGDHAVTDVWRVVGDVAREPLDPDAQPADALIGAVRNALDGLGVVNGAAHTRLNWISTAPVLAGSVGVLDAKAGVTPGHASQASVYASVLAGAETQHAALSRRGRWRVARG